ncbi:MAG: PepSY domain-containing protein [Clostridia bacterium]
MKKLNKKYLGVTTLAMALIIGASANVYATTTDIGVETAKSIALEHAGFTELEATGITCKKDFDNGIFEYDIEFWVENIEYDYEINLSTGVIIEYDWDIEKTNSSKNSKDDKNITTNTEQLALENDYIGQDKAQEIALLHAAVTEDNVTQLKTEFDIERGVAEYEVEWNVGKMEYEYTIDATTGDILKYDVELD